MNERTAQIQAVVKIKNIIKQAKDIAVVSHENPDGDAIGALIATEEILSNAGKNVNVFVAGALPNRFLYMPFVNMINKTEIKPHYDCVIVLDLSDENRMGEYKKLLDISQKVIVIDHHKNPKINADVLLSLPQLSSTCEILYDCLEILDIKINPSVATALYTGIATDTGCFLFSNTTAHTHYVAAELLKQNIEIEKINFVNFREFDNENVTPMLYVIKHTKFVCDKSLAVLVLPYSKVKKWNLSHDKRHGLFKYVTDRKGVLASVFITELKRGEYNVSFRSLGDIDVAKIAEMFGGGGHRNAAGATVKEPISKIKKTILKEFETLLSKK
ncbi:MAG: bifunctional oligoribonuclease/PAP phosphatase NrnA [Christensenellaceae bacterium]|jgi:phosphoesterase RecJ-like protein|nr:bifunctional oligoribonuclease/PAP phosphatase NrnA [Christensenellaceae bacterium]